MSENYRPMTYIEFKESLIFFRRRLTERICVEMIRKGSNAMDIRDVAEDLANAVTELLAARETGKPEGYEK